MACQSGCCSCGTGCSCDTGTKALPGAARAAATARTPDTSLRTPESLHGLVDVPQIFQQTLFGVEAASPASAIYRPSLSHEWQPAEQADVGLTSPQDSWWTDAVGHGLKATVLRRRHLTSPSSDPSLGDTALPPKKPFAKHGPRFVALFAIPVPVSLDPPAKMIVEGGTFRCAFVPNSNFIRGIQVVLLAVRIPGFVFAPQKRVIATGVIGLNQPAKVSGAVLKGDQDGIHKWMVPLKVREGVDRVVDPLKDMAYFLCYLHNDGVAPEANFNDPQTDSDPNNCLNTDVIPPKQYPTVMSGAKQSSGYLQSKYQKFDDPADYWKYSNETNDSNQYYPDGSAPQPATELDEVSLYSISLWWTLG